MRQSVVGVALLTTITVGAQAPPKWDVGAIRRNISGTPVSTLNTRGEKLIAVNVTAEMLIRSAFPFDSYRIFGAPGWWSTDRYDVTAVATGPATPEQIRLMTQQLLADHFNIATHVETRELNTYRLVLARDDGKVGPSLTRFPDDCEALRASGRLPATTPPTTLEDLATVRPCMSSGGPGFFTAGGRTLDALTRMLSGELRALVFDRTGLAGNFNIGLRWNTDPAAGIDAKFPSLTTALQEQLGLRLESGRDPVEVLVIDRLERPTTTD
jgi:uncharacterized protein (TIGR03435 family)